MFPKLSYFFNAIPIKILAGFVTNWEADVKLPTEMQGIQNSRNNLGKKITKLENSQPSISKLITKLQKSTLYSTGISIESRHFYILHFYGQLVFNNSTKTIQSGENSIFSSVKTTVSIYKEWCWTSYSIEKLTQNGSNT